MKTRLDAALVERGLVATRSEGGNWIRLGKVTVSGRTIMKPGFFVTPESEISLEASERYVSRAGLKLASVADVFHLDFKEKVILDVGSSTGGFTDYALQHGAKKVYAVDVGTEQLHPNLRGDERIELHEKTDIRDFRIRDAYPDIIVIDVSFISLRDILPTLVKEHMKKDTLVVAMLKPQFEAGREQVNKGIIKNEAIRRSIIRHFEIWASDLFVVRDKRDSDVTGAKGNRERFYLLTLNRNSTTSPGRIT